MDVMVLSGGKLEAKEIGNTLEELQKIVGGYIEIPFLSEVFARNEIDVVINEEGKFIDGLSPEIAIIDSKENSILDIVYGNCIFVSHDDYGETVSLNDNQIEIIKRELEINMKLMSPNDYSVFNVKALFI